MTNARWTVTLLFLANGLSIGSVAASIPRIAERLSLGPAGVAAYVVVASLGAIVATPFVGRAIDRFGARPVALAGAAVAPLLLPIVLEAESLPLLLGAGFLFGLALGTVEVAMNAYAVAAERAAKASWLSQVHGAWSVGNVLGTLLLAALIARHVPWPSVVPAVLVAGVALAFARYAPPVRHDIVHAGGAAPLRPLVVLGVLAAFALTIEGAMADWAALYARRDLHASEVAAPLVYGVYAGAMMAGRFAGDAAIVRFGRIATLTAGGILAAAGLAAGLASGSLAAVTIAFAVAGLGCANLAPTIFGAAGRIGAGSGMALVTGIGYAAFLGGPAAIGATAQRTGLHAALWIAVASAVVVVAGSLTPDLRRALARATE